MDKNFRKSSLLFTLKALFSLTTEEPFTIQTMLPSYPVMEEVAIV
jgi:hypothetical protein